MLLAIAMASCGKSGLDNETQKRLENSVVYYVKINGVAILWVMHNKDIAEKLLSP